MSFGAGGVVVAGTEGCLFDHQTRPPRTIRTPSAVKSPPAFIRCYLRFHQTETPEKITIRGRKITLVRNMIRMALPVTFRRRSSICLGRIEMRSSSDVSQFIMLRIRSRLATGAERMLLATQVELPTTTMRPWFVPGPTVETAPSANGPFFAVARSESLIGNFGFVREELSVEVEKSFSEI